MLMSSGSLDKKLTALYEQLVSGSDYSKLISREYVADWLIHSGVRNENNSPITPHDWLIDIVAINANITKTTTAVTGAAQVAKTLCSVLCAKLLCEFYPKLRLVWVYATREQGDTYPDIQIQPVFKGDRTARTIKGDKGSRIYIRHANTSVETPSMVGKSLVKSGLASLTADVAMCDEVSQWRSDVSPRDRVKRSVFPSQPIRYYGTPGSGKGIEAIINENNIKTIHCTATCECGLQQRADLYDIIKHDTEANGRPFNYRFKHCECGLSKKHLSQWRFLDNEETTAAIWLHPFLHATTPEQMEEQLSNISTRSLNDASVSNLYQQVLGVINSTGDQAIIAHEIKRAAAPTATTPVARYYGIDQGRKQLYLAEVLDYGDSLFVNYLDGTNLIAAKDYINQHSTSSASFTVCDFAPDAESALWLQNNITHPMSCALQSNTPTCNYDYKLDTAYSNGLPYRIIKFRYSSWVEELISLVKDGKIIFSPNCSELMTRHLTSVRYDASTQRVLRPSDKTDDLFFALMFAMFAKTLHRVAMGRGDQLKVGEWR